MSDVRLTREQSEVLYQADSEARLTRVQAELLVPIPPLTQVTRQQVEAQFQPPSKVRVTRQIVEVQQKFETVARSLEADLALDHEVTGQRIETPRNDARLGHTAAARFDRPRALESNANLHQSVAVNIRQDTKFYSPQVGSGTNPLRPFPIDLEPTPIIKQNDVVFRYPEVGDPDHEVVIKTPEFGDVEASAFDRVSREMRGGTLRVFADRQWPGHRTLIIDFINLKDEEAEEISDFLRVTLGRVIAFRDWEGTLWSGFITTPDTPAIQNRRPGKDMQIEMEVVPQVALCTLTLKQLHELTIDQLRTMSLCGI